MSYWQRVKDSYKKEMEKEKLKHPERYSEEAKEKQRIAWQNVGKALNNVGKAAGDTTNAVGALFKFIVVLIILAALFVIFV